MRRLLARIGWCWGPDRFKADKSGTGTVRWAATDRAIADSDEFILANSSLHPTRMLENFKHDAGRVTLDRSVARTKRLQDFASFLGPEKVQSSVKMLLVIPREPLMNRGF
jgi:hypothetical protein